MPPGNNQQPARSKTPVANKTLFKKSDSSWLVFMAFGLALTLLIGLVFQTIYKTPYSATGIYLNFASQVMDGLIPYRDFPLEYPPLALVFFLIPRLFTSQWPLFSLLYQVEILIFAWLGLWFTFKIALRLGKAPWKLLTPYTLGILVIGPIIGQQYDIFPAVMTLISLYYFWLGRHKTSWFWLAAGILTKLYPAVLIPVYLIIYWRNRQFRSMAVGLLTLGIACLLLLSPFLITGPANLMSLIDYHSQRGIQVESSYAAILLMADQLGWTTVTLGFDHGSWNLNGPLADTFSRLSTWIQAAALLLCYWLIWSQVKRGKSQFTRLGAYSLLLVAVMLVTSKVFSPQYIIWLLPFVALLFTHWRLTMWALFALIGIFTYLIFPVYYYDLLYRHSGVEILLFIRNLTILLLALMAIIFLKRMKSSE
jgi:uncharacterized membrane protein